MIMRYLISACLLFLYPDFSAGQYNRSYFRNPLGIPMQLVANFGEIRTDHFHMGFDLRTNQRENMPVYAAAEGYISRVLIEPGGYGRAIYITHPGGYTTLYAHLNDFYPALQHFVKSRQYQEEKWEQDIEFAKNQFPVSQGQFIAYSGNTGASQGPHLHFEIRDSKTGKNVNPRLFDFPIADRIPPFIYRLFVYDRNYSTYAVEPAEIMIRGGKGSYMSRDSLVETGSAKISFGLSAEDRGNSSSFRFGIYAAELWVDSIKQISFALDEMNYEDSRYMNASIDYRKKMTDGTLIQHLSKLPGNRLSIFDGIHDGVINLRDTLPHDVMIIAKDISGNESVVNFKLAWKPSLNEPRFFTQDREVMPPGVKNTFARDHLLLDIPATSFYDTVPFYHAAINTGHNDLPIHQLHHHYVPVHDAYTVRVKAEGETDPSKMIWKLVSGRSSQAARAGFRDGNFVGSFDKFGILYLLKDTVPPVITPSGWKNEGVLAMSGSLSFAVKDDLGYVDHFRAELDGKWLMFSRRGNIYTYKFDDHCSIGKHELRITARDIAGNETVTTYNFELKEKLPVKKKVKKRSAKKKRR